MALAAQAVVVVGPEVEALAVKVEASTASVVPVEETSAGPSFLLPVKDLPRGVLRQTAIKTSRLALDRIPRSIRRLRRHRDPVRRVPDHRRT